MAFCGMPPMCHAPPGDHTDGTISSSSAPVPDGAGAAVVCTDVIWKGRQALRVYFLNSDLLTGWGLKTETIIEWANGTPDCRAWKEVMEFKETKRREKADIRIEFSEKKISWCMIGMCAAQVKDPNPTMVLNLVDTAQCPPNPSAQRSLVIHEFGHALGLSHEHQRVDFWETVKPYMDTERMMDDERVKKPVSEYGKQTIGTDWFKQVDSLLSKFLGLFRYSRDELKTEEFEYDPTSIMHYGFDIDWIKDPQYHIRRNFEGLNEKERKYIGGIHTRHGGLAESASETDIDVLQKYYQKNES